MKAEEFAIELQLRQKTGVEMCTGKSVSGVPDRDEQFFPGEVNKDRADIDRIAAGPVQCGRSED